ncbi:hypothetical protein K458DRAFT_206691 [Lentithecium fluviatile CBS 122367]|uniref:Uncharacterized protein n=1 Tax=Lentithecium fluviatile CBS 122367 TaxID=1168545 RepID=A0A6G1IBT0_9PLEO|nr:hypothetical protein K458DRAFT_206691 [Lentithecium fluviatile CBS 122367]
MHQTLAMGLHPIPSRRSHHPSHRHSSELPQQGSERVPLIKLPQILIGHIPLYIQHSISTTFITLLLTYPLYFSTNYTLYTTSRLFLHVLLYTLLLLQLQQSNQGRTRPSTSSTTPTASVAPLHQCKPTGQGTSNAPCRTNRQRGTPPPEHTAHGPPAVHPQSTPLNSRPQSNW